MRTKYIDPDFRRNPKIKLWCCRCQKDIQDGANFRFAYLAEGGFEVIHPDDAPEGERAWPIGLDCAQRIGFDWSIPLPTPVKIKVAPMTEPAQLPPEITRWRAAYRAANGKEAPTVTLHNSKGGWWAINDGTRALKRKSQFAAMAARLEARIP